jgi:hypothetical protein
MKEYIYNFLFLRFLYYLDLIIESCYSVHNNIRFGLMDIDVKIFWMEEKLNEVKNRKEKWMAQIINQVPHKDDQ